MRAMLSVFRMDCWTVARQRCSRTNRSFVALCTISCVLFASGCGRIDPEAELAAAQKSFAAHDYSEAGIRLNSVIQVQSDNAAARKLRGELALALGDYPRAAEELERARTLGIPSDQVALGLAQAKTALGEWEDAIALLDAAEAALGKDPLYWTTRAEALLVGRRTPEAERALEAADAAGGGGSRAQIAAARIAFAGNDAATAEAVLSKALASKPDDPQLSMARAELLARTDRMAQSAADYVRAADLFEKAHLSLREAEALLALLQVQLAQNDLDGAEANAARLAKVAPNAAVTNYSRALVDYRRGRFDDAATLLQPVVSASPDTPQFRALLGAIYLARGNLFQAEQQFVAVLAVSPRDPAAIKLLAETRLRQRRPDAALSALRTIEDTATQDPQVGLLSGLASLQAGDTDRGLLYLEQAASLDPANQLLKLQLARAYVVAGRDADAQRLLQSTFGAGAPSLEAGLLRLFTNLRSGDAQTSDAAATQLLTEFPRDPRAMTAVALYYQSRGDTRRARELFEQAAKSETDGATARLFLAASFVQEGRSQDAEKILTELVKQQPDNAQALAALGELLASRGALAEAADRLLQAAEHTDSVTPRLELAQLRIRQGDVAEAKRQLDVAAKAAPDNPEVAAVGGVVALAEGRAGDAVALLEKAEAALPNRLGVSLMLARAQLAAGSAERARATLEKILAVAPKSLPVRLALGEAELQSGNASAALTIAADLKAEFPSQAGGYLLEADALVAGRRYASAADGLSAAFQREPSWPVLIRLVRAQQLAGRPNDALDAARRWSDANPQQVSGLLLYASLLEQARRSEDALKVYESVLALDRNNVPALNNAAWLAQTLGRSDALDLAQRAQKLAVDDPSVLDTLGWILLSEKREPESIIHLSRAAKLAPNVPAIHYHFAAALAAAGRADEARSELTALLQSTRDFEQRADAQRLLNSL